MLSQADYDLAMRDRAIPGLAAALDAEQAGRVFSGAWPGLGIREAVPAGREYAPGKSCTAAFITRTGEGITRAYLKVSAPGAALREGEGGAAIPAIGAIACRYPADLVLGPLPCAAHPYLPGAMGRARSVTVLRYVPERRSTARVVMDAGAYAVRVQGAPSPRPLSAERPVRAVSTPPEVCGESPPGSVVTGWLAGTPLAEILREGGSATALAVAGRALAAWHRATIAREPATASPLAAEACAAAEVVAALSPPLGDLARGLAARLARWVPVAPPFPVIGAGPSLRNILFDGERVGFSAAGLAGRVDPAADLGRLVADIDLARAGCEWPGSPSPLAAELLCAYRAAGGRCDTAHLRWYAAVTLLASATRPFSRGRADWPLRIRDALTLAQRHVEGLS